jgi:hypothetical protein
MRLLVIPIRRVLDALAPLKLEGLIKAWHWKKKSGRWFFHRPDFRLRSIFVCEPRSVIVSRCDLHLLHDFAVR